jgi:hypothetical protein
MLCKVGIANGEIRKKSNLSTFMNCSYLKNVVVVDNLKVLSITSFPLLVALYWTCFYALVVGVIIEIELWATAMELPKSIVSSCLWRRGYCV